MGRAAGGRQAPCNVLCDAVVDRQRAGLRFADVSPAPMTSRRSVRPRVDGGRRTGATCGCDQLDRRAARDELLRQLRIGRRVVGVAPAAFVRWLGLGAVARPPELLVVDGSMIGIDGRVLASAATDRRRQGPPLALARHGGAHRLRRCSARGGERGVRGEVPAADAIHCRAPSSCCRSIPMRFLLVLHLSASTQRIVVRGAALHLHAARHAELYLKGSRATRCAS